MKEKLEFSALPSQRIKVLPIMHFELKLANQP